MNMTITRTVVAMVLGITLAGCSISTRVKPVEQESIAMVCIKENPDVMMDGFLPELKSQISSYGIETRTYTGETPADCPYHMQYTANWQWDLAMYLTYAELKVFKHTDLVGEAVYDARQGGANMDKFGTTADKLRTLTEPLFNHHTPSKTQ